MENEEIRTFKEGLDTDTEDRDLPPSRYRDARNALSGSSSESNVGSMENVQANVLRNLVVGWPDFNEDFAGNSNTWLLNQNLILPPCLTTIGPNLQFAQDNLGVAEQGNVVRSMLATDYTYEINIVVTTPTSAPLNGSLKVYVGESDSAPFEITEAGTYTIEKPANGSKLIIEALFSGDTLLGQTWNVTGLEVVSENKPLVLTGTSKVIGSVKDIRNNAIIYMVYNSEGKHKFIRFYVNTKRIQDILPGTDTTVLGWTPTSYIWNAKIVETGTDQLLFFLDDTTKLPRRLNTSLWENRGSSYAYTLVEDDISVAKKPPIKPTIEMALDETFEEQYLTQKFYQFIVRYKYEDGEYSSFSPISDISMSPYLYFVGTKDTYKQSNCVDITTFSGVDVLEIEFACRLGNGVSEDGTINPQWYIWKILPNTFGNNATVVTRFYGNELKLIVSRTDTDKLFEVVPLQAGAQEIVEGNQAVYFDILEGYNKSEVDITTGYDFDTYPQKMYDVDQGDSDVFWRQAGEVVSNDVFRYYEVDPSLPQPQVGDLLVIAVNVYTDTSGTTLLKLEKWKRIITQEDIDSDMEDVSDWIEDNLTSAGIPYTFSTASFYYQFTLSTTQYTWSSLMVQGASAVPYWPQNYLRTSFKEGATHDMGIIFCDQYLRQGPFIKLDSVSIPSLTERYPVSGDYTYIQQRAKLTIDYNATTPPEWAYHYIIAHKSNLKQTASLVVNDITSDEDGISIDVQYSYASIYEEQLIKEFNEFGAENLRCRFLTRKYAAANNQLAKPREVSSLNVVWNIAKWDTSTKTFTITAPDDVYVNIEEELGQGSLIEIFLSEQEQSEIYFERYFGTIQNPGTISRAFDYPSIELTNGDVYRKWRQYKYGNATARQYYPAYHVETRLIDDFSVSNFNSQGRVQAETPNYRQQRLETMVRWGGKLFQDTQINNMSTFDEGNYRILSAKYGAITAAREIGYTLKIMQEANYSTAFIGRREIQNADGSTQLVVTDSLIGSVNYSEDEYGTKQKGSVVVNDRNLYFFDTIKGVFIRESGNAPFPISNYYMVRYFSNKALQAENGDFMVISGFDNWASLLWVHMVGENYSETLCFEDKDGQEFKRWKSFQDLYLPVDGEMQGAEMLGAIGRTFTSYLNGYLWEHYQDGYLNYFGVERQMVVKSVFNMGAKQVKVFNNHSIHANTTPVYCIFTTPPVTMYPVGMRSKLVSGNYKGREGVYYSDIKGDGYTKGLVADNSAQFKQQLVSGRNMRAHVLSAELVFETQDLINLYSHEVGITYSPKS